MAFGTTETPSEVNRRGRAGSLRIPDSSRPAVSIIIANWNGSVVLPHCLDSLAAQTFTDYEIIIVDNGSSDHSVDKLNDRWDGIRLFKLDHNLGFAFANNYGAQQARGYWLLLLNNDAFPEPEWLYALMKATQEYPEYAFFGSRLVQAENPDLLDGTGDVYHVSGLAWRRHYNQPDSQIEHRAEEIFGPTAAAALYSREAFFQVGGFDEDYFSYHEDVDLSFRLRLVGYRCLYVPDAVVKHVGSASQGKKSDFTIYYGHRNLVWSFFQNMPSVLLWKYLWGHLITNIFFIIYYAFRGKGRIMLLAKLDAFREIKKVLRKRRIIQHSRTVEHYEIAKVLERGWLRPYMREFLPRLNQR